jgi:hypothetical protein
MHTLRAQHPHSAVLAIDMEGHDENISQIGIAMLPSLSTLLSEHQDKNLALCFLAPEGDLRSFVLDYDIQVHNIKFEGHGSRRFDRNREKFKY